MGRSLILELHFCLCVLVWERKEKKKRREIKEREGEGKSVAVDVAKFRLLQLFILCTITIKHNSNINTIFLIYKTSTYVRAAYLYLEEPACYRSDGQTLFYIGDLSWEDKKKMRNNKISEKKKSCWEWNENEKKDGTEKDKIENMSVVHRSEIVLAALVRTYIRKHVRTYLDGGPTVRQLD